MLFLRKICHLEMFSKFLFDIHCTKNIKSTTNQIKLVANTSGYKWFRVVLRIWNLCDFFTDEFLLSVTAEAL